MDRYQEALDRFRELWARARSSDIPEPDAFTLATADAGRGAPSARVVLLKDLDDEGFVFYTNRRSRKAHQLDDNPHAALCFYWGILGTQVLVEGVAKPVSDAEADAYWQSRSRLSQLGAWASHQSELLADRAELEERLARYEQEFRDREVPRPPHWSGYRVEPEMIEFWSAREGRLHDRERYIRQRRGWEKVLVNP